ncbi:hypothetical protein ABEV41_03675 [Geobacillus thermodenitrificans]|uniref:hypothetical protein n=1 Tax=Geobacillus thermodenitrificans TaxID=33940 RepID=UPI003D2461BB
MMLLDEWLIVVHFFYQVSDGYLRRRIEWSLRRNTTVSMRRLEAVVLSVEVRNVYIGLLILSQCAERFEQNVFGMVPRIPTAIVSISTACWIGCHLLSRLETRCPFARDEWRPYEY